MKTKAFTLMETMIVVVILGLLIAMIIPACQKVRHNSLKAKVERGERLTVEEAKSYKILNKTFEREKSQDKIELKDYQEITIDGRTYYLVPKE